MSIKFKTMLVTLFLALLLATVTPVTALTTYLEDFDNNTTLEGWGKHRKSGDILEVSSNWPYGESVYSLHLLLDGYSPELVKYSMGVQTTEIASIRMACNSHEAYVKAKVYVTKGINNLAGDRECLMFIVFWGTSITPEGPVELIVGSVGQARFGVDYFTFNKGNGVFCWKLANARMGTGAWYSVEMGFIRGASMYGKIAGHTITNTAYAVNITMIEVGLMVTKTSWSGVEIEAYIDDVEVRANGISPAKPSPPNGNGNGNQTNGNGLPDWLQGILEFLGVDLMTFLLICIVIILVLIFLFKRR